MSNFWSIFCFFWHTNIGLILDIFLNCFWTISDYFLNYFWTPALWLGCTQRCDTAIMFSCCVDSYTCSNVSKCGKSGSCLQNQFFFSKYVVFWNKSDKPGVSDIFCFFFKFFLFLCFRRVFESEINQKTQKLNISRIWPYGWGGVSSNIHILSHSWQVEEVTTPFSMWFSHRASRNAFDGWWHPYPWSTAAKTRTARDSWSKNCPVSAPGEVLQRFLFQTRSTGDIWGYIG